MTRKVIQVVSDPISLLVLCDDGTMWRRVGPGWQQISGPTERTLASDVVAELRARAERAYDHRENYALNEAADLVAEKLAGET